MPRLFEVATVGQANEVYRQNVRTVSKPNIFVGVILKQVSGL